MEPTTDISLLSWMKAEEKGYTRKQWCLAMSKRRQKPKVSVVPTVKKKEEQKKTFSKPLEIYSCIHRGDVVEMTTCLGCAGGKRPLEIFSCEKHKECTVDRLGDKPEVAVCKLCVDRVGKPLIE